MGYTANGPLERWLANESPEAVLEPELPIIDPHHHLWDLRRVDRGAGWRFQQQVYLCEEVTDDIQNGGHNIVQTVFAQCGAFYRADGPEHMRCVGETEFVHGVVAMSRSGLYGATRLCTGIFGTADLRLGRAVEEVIEAHLSSSPNFRGIRCPLPDELDDRFLEGYAVLRRHGLSYDNYSPEFARLPTLARIAREHPEVPVIVNHLGGKVDPAADEDTKKQWQRCVASIAECPNAFMKLGGAQQRVGIWTPPFHNEQRQAPIGSEELCELLYPYYAYAIEVFGADRCMFESNFPVDKESVSYRTIWNTFKRIAAKAGLDDREKASIFAGTAARAYRLTAPA